MLNSDASMFTVGVEVERGGIVQIFLNVCRSIGLVGRIFPSFSSYDILIFINTYRILLNFDIFIKKINNIKK